MTYYSFPLSGSLSPVSMRREMDRFVNEVFGAPRANGAKASVSPMVDAVEDATGFTLEIELPGIAPEAVEVTAEEGTLTVRAQKPAKELAEGSRLLFRERESGAIERRFRLPKTADLADINASYAHGVLSVRVAKSAPAQPRRVPVTVNVDQG